MMREKNINRAYRVVVIGMSAGGSEPLLEILSALPGDYPLPLVVVQHLHPHQEGPAILYRAPNCALRLKEAVDKEAMQPGVVYFAPPNYHLLVEDNGTFSLNVDPKVNFTRPAIDVLFESAADAFGPHLIGVVLSGANGDGAAGLRTIRQHGGLGLVQDPLTAQVDLMPRLAIQAAFPDFILPPTAIGRLLLKLAVLE
jgi:two-component system, chemotaxis family, protein-glutamate methylesterase/glutaminase